MRILANENFPGDVVEILRAAGHEVVWIRTDAPGASDEVVLQKAQRECRIVATFDKDFGELAYRYGLPASCRILLFRIPPLSPDYTLQIVLEAMNARSDWSGCFAVVEPARIRIRSTQSK